MQLGMNAYRKRARNVYTDIDTEDDLAVLDSGKLLLANPRVRQFLLFWTRGHRSICPWFERGERRELDDPADLQERLRGWEAVANEVRQLRSMMHLRLRHLWQSSHMYEELSENHIRLLRILPGRKGTELEISLKPVPLYESTLFETLSYTWGGPRVRSIRCGRHLLTITENLFRALHALRSEVVERVLWIDAICINQDDNSEKEKQVKMMKRIYSISQKTTVWLSVFRCLPPPVNELMDDLIRIGQNYSGRIDLTTDRAIWVQFAELFKDPWFSRMWIVQEVAVSRDIVVSLESQAWSWDDLVMAARVARDHAKGAQTIFEPADMIKLSEIRQVHLQKKPSNILQVLLQTRLSLASKNIDKVNAALGMADTCFEPSYAETASMTFSRFAIDLIQGDNSQKMLLLNLVNDRIYSGKTDLPFWVPDWEVRHGPNPFATWPVFFDKWCKGGNTCPKMELSNNGRSLHVQGFVLDRIRSVGLPFRDMVLILGPNECNDIQLKPTSLRKTYLRSVRQTLRRTQQWYDIAVMHGHFYGDRQARFHAFLQTLTASSGLEEFDKTCNTDLAYGFRSWHDVVAWYLTDDGHFVQKCAMRAGSAAIGRGMEFMVKNVNTAWGRRLFAGRDLGIIGLCSSLVRSGDLVVVLNGGLTPYVFREAGTGKYKFLGECYAHGMMNAVEAMRICRGQTDELQDFELI